MGNAVSASMRPSIGINGVHLVAQGQQRVRRGKLSVVQNLALLWRNRRETESIGLE
jgi:hypothetical protein